jgi:hypothetical protein
MPKMKKNPIVYKTLWRCMECEWSGREHFDPEVYDYATARALALQFAIEDHYAQLNFKPMDDWERRNEQRIKNSMREEGPPKTVALEIEEGWWWAPTEEDSDNPFGAWVGPYETEYEAKYQYVDASRNEGDYDGAGTDPDTGGPADEIYYPLSPKLDPTKRQSMKAWAEDMSKVLFHRPKKPPGAGGGVNGLMGLPSWRGRR